MSVTALKKTKLRGVAPENVEPRKPKVLIYGPPGVGKTWTALDFPNVYYFDTEGGADLSHYREKLRNAGGMYFGPSQGSLDFDTVIAEVETLATERHQYKTMVFDSISKLFAAAIADEQARLGSDDVYGASKKAPIRQMTRLVRWINRADMNAVIIAHQTDEWGKDEKGKREAIGVTFDAWIKLAYELHLILRISKIGAGSNAKRFAHIGKSRLTGFPEGERFDWSFSEFAARYGKDVIEEEVKPVVLATPEQVLELKRLLEIVKLPDGITDKWLTKAGVDCFEELDTETITKCTAFLQEKLK